MQRILIFGHEGQDGRILSEQLHGAGCLVAGFGRNTVSGVDGWRGPVDILNPTDVRQVVADFRPGQIFFFSAHHHSSQAEVTDPLALQTHSWALNVHAFENVVEAVNREVPEASIFYASSSKVFGDAPDMALNEASRRAPRCIYGLTKAAAMDVAAYYRRVHGARISCGILFNHESPFRRPDFLSRRVVDGLVAVRKGRIERLEVGDLSSQVDWGYAPDFTRAMRQILDGGHFEDFVIATGELHSVLEMVEIVADHLGLEASQCVAQTSALVRRRSVALKGDPALLKRLTGWEPTVSFEEMVRLLVEAAIARDAT